MYSPVRLLVVVDITGRRLNNMWYGMPEGIIGTKIESFVQKGDVISLFGSDKVIRLTCSGDCCSTSWFEHVDDMGAFPGTILSIDNDGYSPYPVGESDGGEDIKVYFLTIKTDKGRFTVDMRNSSNGYYGGSFNWSVEAK